LKQIIHREEGEDGESIPSMDEIGSQSDPPDQITYLARVYFSCEVLFAVEPRWGSNLRHVATDSEERPAELVIRENLPVETRENSNFA
jgi:hypothetical protein